MATIDERLEALVARHEALTQTVELTAGMQQQTEKELRILSKLAAKILTSHDERITKLEKGK